MEITHIETHFVSFSQFLSPLENSYKQQSLRLQTLTNGQFIELSTDVYDELTRRLKNTEDSLQVSLYFYICLYLRYISFRTIFQSDNSLAIFITPNGIMRGKKLQRLPFRGIKN
jgi:hypothetical protein